MTIMQTFLLMLTEEDYLRLLRNEDAFAFWSCNMRNRITDWSGTDIVEGAD